jgi:peptidyl-prolyl cis-trans isomerase C
MTVIHRRTSVVALIVVFALAGGCASSAPAEGKQERESLTEQKQEPDASESTAASDDTADEARARGSKAEDSDKDKASPDLSEGESELPVVATGPVAIVDGHEIGAEAFNERIRRRVRDHSSVPHRVAQVHKRRALQIVIDDYLITRQLDEEGIQVSESEVEAELETFKSRFPNERSIASFMEHAGGEARVRADMRKSLRLKKLLEKLYQIEVSEQEARAHYNKNKERYQEPERVRARHILIKVEENASEESLAAAEERAQELADQARAGADFAELAREHSQGPTRTRGGDLGYFPRKRMVEAFEKVAFSMKKGEVSDPVKTQFGYHVIKLVDRKAATEHVFEDVDDEIYERLEQRNLRRKADEFVKTLREEADIQENSDNIVINVEKSDDAGGVQGRTIPPELLEKLKQKQRQNAGGGSEQSTDED